MSTYSVLMCVPMVALLVWAAVEDIGRRRIPNWLTLGLILSGILQSLRPGQALSPGQAMLGMLAGAGLPFVLFALEALGGGDVKLLAGVGSWLGALGVFHVFLASAVFGLILVLSQAAYQRRIGTLLRNSAVVAINLAHVNELGPEHVIQTGQQCRSVDRPLPYAVPVLLGTVLLIARSWS